MAQENQGTTSKRTAILKKGASGSVDKGQGVRDKAQGVRDKAQGVRDKAQGARVQDKAQALGAGGPVDKGQDVSPSVVSRKVQVSRVRDTGSNVIVQYNTPHGPRRSLVPVEYMTVQYGTNALYVEESVLRATRGNDGSIDWLDVLAEELDKPEKMLERISLEMRYRGLFYWQDLLAAEGLNALNSAVRAALQFNVSKLSLLAHKNTQANK